MIRVVAVALVTGILSPSLVLSATKVQTEKHEQ
jgi:hypothetical protein